MSWARKHDKCVKCGTTETRHRARGLCTRCYQVDIELRYKTPKFGFRRRIKFAIQSMDNLALEYSERKMSLGDLAKKYNCTRQYIYKLLKQHGVLRRDQSAARTIALNEGKLAFTRTDETGNESRVVLQKININKNFFKSWSPAMAYVLGVIYTDGNLIPSSRRDSKYKSRSSRFSVSQKEPELLEKVLALMDCDAKLYRSKQRRTGNPIHEFHVNDEEVYDDLLKLGLTPKKSLTLEFPDIPAVYVRHFIRGCWDGDGSVSTFYGRPQASFVTGSKTFAEGILKHLVSFGLPPAKMYLPTNGRTYSFYFRGDNACVKLYHVFYDDVPEEMRLTRKFERFKQFSLGFEGYRIQLEKDLPFIIPERLTRATLVDFLDVNPKQIRIITQSEQIPGEIRKLRKTLKSGNVEEIKTAIEALKSQVNEYLYGWQDEGWDDLD